MRSGRLGGLGAGAGLLALIAAATAAAGIELSRLEQLFGGGFLVALIAAIWGPIRDVRSGALRKGRAEADAAEANMHAAGAEAQVELVERTSIFLAGRLAATEDRLRVRDDQLRQADELVDDLRRRLRERDEQLDDLERRLEHCEGSLATVRDELDQAIATITALRSGSDTT